MPDFETLRSLVHASPAYHQAYVLVRREVLQSPVQRQHNHVSISEAIATVRSFNVHARTPCHTEMVIALLDRRRRAEETQHFTTGLWTDKFISLEEMIKLLYVQRVAGFFLEDFCRSAPCPPWTDSTKWAAEFLPIQLSENETSRFLRAFYRLQIFCNLFGSRKNHSEEYFPNHRSLTKPTLSEAFSHDEMWELFFATMPLWEVEEFACAWVYFRNQWVRVSKEVAPYLSRDGPRFGGIAPGCTPGDCFELHPDGIRLIPCQCVLWGMLIHSPIDSEYQDRLDHIITMGPRFLYKVFHQGTYKKRCELVADNTAMGRLDLISVVDSTYLDWDNDWLIFPADKYQRDDFLAALPLKPPLEQPNMAWIRHYYEDGMIDDLPPKKSCLPLGYWQGWEWAYVLWDLETLRSWQAPSLVGIETSYYYIVPQRGRAASTG